ncbi:MAG: tyrosine-type recombinase/integrase [Phototrophicaceae bacterium]
MTKKQLPMFPSQPTSSDEISKQTPIGVTLEHFKRYLTREGKSAHTVKAFIGDMKLLCEHSGDDTLIGDFSTTSLNEYLDWMENHRGVACSRKTYARRVTTLKVYFKWLKHLEALKRDPALAILQRSGPAPLSNVLTNEQVDAVLEVARSQKKGDNQDYRPELLFRLLLQTGIKKSEAGRLTLEDFDREHPNVIIKHKAKNIYKERRITLDSDFMLLLELYTEQYHPKDAVFTCTTRNLEYILTDLGKDAGVPFKLSFEVMRWTMGLREWRAGEDEDEIREKLGLSQTSWYETSNKIKRLVAQQITSENAIV